MFKKGDTVKIRECHENQNLRFKVLFVEGDHVHVKNLSNDCTYIYNSYILELVERKHQTIDSDGEKYFVVVDDVLEEENEFYSYSDCVKCVEGKMNNGAYKMNTCIEIYKLHKTFYVNEEIKYTLVEE